MSVPAPARILHVITGLGLGGAEMTLLRLLERLARSEFEPAVVSLTTAEPLGSELRRIGIPVLALGFRAGVPDPRMLTRLGAEMRRFQPALVQAWMYHANLVASLAARRAGAPPVIWGIHHNVADPRALKPATRWVARANAWLSGSAARIVCVAEAARLSHLRMGFAPERLTVIPNGFDTERYHPDASARARLTAELGLPGDVPLVGLCARFHPHKDHRTFLEAAGKVHTAMPQAHFILWGSEVEPGNARLMAWVHASGVEAVTHCLGARSDSPSLFAALDLAVLSSYTEAFPLVLGEAMACAVPCISTAAGDADLIIGETGKIVPLRSPQALASAILDLLSRPEARRALGASARARIEAQFSLARMAAEYARMYRDIITGSRA